MNISEYFAGQTVFITGGTGLIGKVLVEKLLRCCPDLGCIYLAVREKKGVSPPERLQKIFELPIFENLKKTNPAALEKVKLITADMKHPTLGISEADREDLIKNITIVYHVAATVQFVDNLITTLEQNTRATYQMVLLAKEIQNLMVFVYVSTCYTNFFRQKSEWNEKLYPAVQDWRVILKLVEEQPLQLAMMKERLLGGHPNPYTFSKSLAEQIVADHAGQFKSTVIVRPSVVSSALEEPLTGWVDSLNGMAVLCIANSFGILRVARHSNEAHQDYVPVDIVSKFLCIAPWAARHREKEEYPIIYNCTIGDLKTMRTSEISRLCSKSQFVEEFPSKYIVWTRNLKLVKNPYKYQMQFFLEQILPACLLDTAIYLYGSKPLFLRIVKKLAYANQTLFKDFQFSEVHFKNDKFLEVMWGLEGENKEVFGSWHLYKMSELELDDIIRDIYIGVLKYYFKEDLSEKNMIKNKKRYNRIKMLESVLRIAFYSGIAYLGQHYLREFFGSYMDNYMELTDTV